MYLDKMMLLSNPFVEQRVLVLLFDRRQTRFLNACCW